MKVFTIIITYKTGANRTVFASEWHVEGNFFCYTNKADSKNKHVIPADRILEIEIHES